MVRICSVLPACGKHSPQALKALGTASGPQSWRRAPTSYSFGFSAFLGPGREKEQDRVPWAPLEPRTPGLVIYTPHTLICPVHQSSRIRTLAFTATLTFTQALSPRHTVSHTPRQSLPPSHPVTVPPSRPIAVIAPTWTGGHDGALRSAPRWQRL